MEYEKLRKMMSKFLGSQNKIILSVSVVSLIFSNSYWFFACLSSLKLYFSTYPFHLLGLALNKNCIFLICNGLLVFVVKTSGGSVRSSSASDLNELLLNNKIGDSLQPTLDTKEPSLLIKDIADVDSTEDEEKEENEAEASSSSSSSAAAAAEEEEEECLCEEEKKLTTLVVEDLEVDDPGDGGGENESEIGLLLDEDEEKEEEEEEKESMELLSTDELNKKFEDFILRMKEDIRMGSSTPTNYIGQVHYNYDINLYDKNWPIMIAN